MDKQPCADRPAGLEALPPSARTLFYALRCAPPMTGRQIRDETGMPRRTVFTALKELESTGLLHKRPSLKDTRQTYYWLERPDSAAAA